MHAAAQASINTLVHSFHEQVVVFVFVLSRVSGLLVTAPAFGSRGIPMRIRAFVAVSVSLLVSPLYWQQVTETPRTLLQLASIVTVELAVGMTLGLGVLIVLLGLQLSGLIASHMSGMALADVFDAGTGSSTPVFSQLLDLVGLSVFLIIGGHRILTEALLDTFQSFPPGSAWISLRASGTMATILTESFVLGLRVAAPIIVSLLTSVIVLGLISRTLPQLNVLVVGFSMNSILMLAMLAITLGSIGWLFQGRIEPTIIAILESFTTRAATN